jgi:hypothetical protein
LSGNVGKNQPLPSPPSLAIDAVMSSQTIAPAVQLITEAEAAGMLRISRNRVKNLLPRVRLSSRRTRYDLRDVVALIERSKEQS